MRRLLLTAAVAAASVFVLSGCGGAGPSGAALGTVWPEPPPGEVIAQGTVLEADGAVELCLGPIAESYPPQCSGLPLEGWDWDAVDGEETASGVTWGAYAVRGTYDGETFGVTEQPILLALYDPMAPPDPTGGRAGQGDPAELARIQEELPDRLDEAYLSSGIADGWLHVDVVWDDGTWQQAADAEFGEDVVLIRSALQPLDG